jgi:hypothetical protein
MHNWLLVLGPDMPLHLCGLRKGYALKMLMESWAHGSQFLQPDVDRHKSIAFLLLEKYIVYIYWKTHHVIAVGCHVAVDWCTGRVSIRKLISEY